MMRLWKVVLLVNLALGVGIGLGYLHGAREVRDLRQELVTDRAAVSPSPGERVWTIRGIVRLVLPEQRTIFITHETIPGLMPGMTMGFEAGDPELLSGLNSGDSIRFTLREKGSRVLVVAIEKIVIP